MPAAHRLTVDCTLLPDLSRADIIAQVLNKETGEVETMIVQAKRERGRPRLDERMAALEAALEALRKEVAELRRPAPE